MRVAFSIKNLSCVAAVALLGSCQTVTRLPDGQLSAMSAESNGTRSQIIVTPTPITEPLVYRPVGVCHYTQIVTPYRQATIRNEVQIGVEQEGDGLYVTIIEDNKDVSTSYMDIQGNLRDFNVLTTDGERVNTETLENEANQRLDEFNARTNKPDARVLNTMTMFLPAYSSPPYYPGEDVAIVRDSSNSMWGSYRYRGLTQISGMTAAVFDLTRVFPNNPDLGPALVGFNVVDLETMWPIVVVLDAGLSARVERDSCAL